MGRYGIRTDRAGASAASLGQDRGMARAQANGLELEYGTFGDPAAPPLVLVMGLGAQMITWDDGFCELLASRGFFVVRYDNRDVGLSTYFDELPPPDLGALFMRRPVERAVPAGRSGRRRRRAVRRARHREGPRRGRVDGRDDRAAAGDRPPGPAAERHVDHVDHGRSGGRAGRAVGAGGADAAMRPPRASRRWPTASRATGGSAPPVTRTTRRSCWPRPRCTSTAPATRRARCATRRR